MANRKQRDTNWLQNSAVPAAFSERHFSIAELSELWGQHPDALRSIFRNIPGAVNFGRGNFRIPESIAKAAHAEWDGRWPSGNNHRTRLLKIARQKLGGKCVRCGATSRLEFDHVDFKTKSFALVRSPNDKAFWAEVAKCQLLCFPCHRAKTVIENRQRPSKLIGKAAVVLRPEHVGKSCRALSKELGISSAHINRIRRNVYGLPEIDAARMIPAAPTEASL